MDRKGEWSDPLVADPFPPLARRPARAQPPGETLLDHVIDDLLRGDLQSEEGVDPRERSAESCASGGIDLAAVPRARDFEVLIDVEPPEGIAAGAEGAGRAARTRVSGI